jgi:hypothetical protein
MRSAPPANIRPRAVEASANRKQDAPASYASPIPVSGYAPILQYLVNPSLTETPTSPRPHPPGHPLIKLREEAVAVVHLSGGIRKHLRAVASD